MPDNGQLIEKYSISMYPSDWAIVDEADKNDAGRSPALRTIVREWAEWRALRTPPHQILTGPSATYSAPPRDAAHEVIVSHFRADGVEEVEP